MARQVNISFQNDWQSFAASLLRRRACVAQQMGQSLSLGKAISANEFGFGKLRVFC